MSDQLAKDLISQGEKLFSKRIPLLSYWQELAENFYPQRADFTRPHNMGEDFASNLTTSYPLLAHRELSSLISSFLRPNGQKWFQISVSREDKIDDEGRAWLQSRTDIQRRAMYDRVAQLSKATKIADADFVLTGQAVLSCKLNKSRDALLHTPYHLRDVVWAENSEGMIDEVHRKWRPTARQLAREFKDGIHPKAKERADKKPHEYADIRHIILPSDYVNEKEFKRYPFVSFYIDIENQHTIEKIGVNHMEYVIPRWQQVSNSQYAYSPCAVCALPDARLIQAMTLVLLEAGEKAVNPPLIATKDVVRTDVAMFAGGITWVDQDYDERQGEALRAMTADVGNIPIGMELRNDIKMAITEAFYLNKINLPPAGKDMTAFEVNQRIQEYVRNAMPLFEPMEVEYNGALCEADFNALMDGGAFGSMFDIPESLRKQEIQFKFENPLYQAEERQKGRMFQEAKAMLAEAIPLDQGSVGMIDVRKALRDVLHGIGTPEAWLRSDIDMQEMERAIEEKQQTMDMLSQMQKSGEVAEQAGKAAQSFQGV